MGAISDFLAACSSMSAWRSSSSSPPRGALTALLIPTPTPKLLAVLRSLLAPHNVKPSVAEVEELDCPLDFRKFRNTDAAPGDLRYWPW